MSNSVLNNKFKKWSSLLAQNPDNVDYKNKVSKYGTLMVRAVQGGGNGNGEVDELLRKIDGVVRKNNMNGGGKQVTGYRNMRGGGGSEDVDIISVNIETLQRKIQEQANAYDALVAEFDPIIKQLITKLDDEKTKVAQQVELVKNAQKELETTKETLQAQANASGSEKDKAHAQQLQDLQNQLAQAKLEGENKMEALEKQISELKSKVEAVVTEASQVKNTTAKDTLLTQARNALSIQPGGSRRTTRRH
jgi:molecular chaperone DnaK (HSP70)